MVQIWTARRQQKHATHAHLYPFEHRRPLGIKLYGIPFMTLLLAVFEPAALVVLQHPMLATEVPRADPPVPDDPLRRVLAIFECAAKLLGWHATPYWECELQR